MKLIADKFASFCWWLVKRVARFSTRNMGSTIYTFANPLPLMIPRFEIPANYVETPGGKSGNWRFCLNSNIRINLWNFAGVGYGHKLCEHDQRIEFADEDGRVWMTIFSDGTMEVSAGYAWNGCSPKWWAFGRWWGTPDPVATRLASLIHDVLYQFGHTVHFPFNRDACDMVFYNIMVACSLDRDFAGTYYGAVCKLGCRFFKKNDCYSFVTVIE